MGQIKDKREPVHHEAEAGKAASNRQYYNDEAGLKGNELRKWKERSSFGGAAPPAAAASDPLFPWNRRSQNVKASVVCVKGSRLHGRLIQRTKSTAG